MSSSEPGAGAVALTGDVAALRLKLLRTAWALVGDRHNAEDLVHETLAAVMSTSTTVDDVEGYARTALVNRVRSRWRRLERERNANRRAGSNVRDDVVMPDPSGEVWAAVQELPYRQRVAVVLVVVEDLPLRDVAAQLVCSEETARTHLRRGKQKLESQLQHLKKERS